MAVFRSDWGRRADWLAADLRDPRAGERLELGLAGRVMLGPSWDPPARGTRPRLDTHPGPSAACLEWSFQEGSRHVLRTLVFFRSRRLALLAEEVQNPGPLTTFRLVIPPGVGVRPSGRGPSLRLDGPGRASAHILTPGLSDGPAPEAGGVWSVADGKLVVTQQTPTRRAWIPLLISWDPTRDRRAPTWRRLTVAEQSRVCPPDVAVAFRVQWGRGDSLILYRSLARAGLRSFLGHQTRARFLVGVFGPQGDIAPLVTLGR